ncbi:MAG: OmpA family protein [Muribaculaceae bacterium]|nr:OmpA family protein [Muribaculaceae bacterium]
MKKFLMLLSMLLVVGATVDVNAQGWLKKLGKTAEKAAKNAVERSVERNVDRKTEKAVDNVFDGNVNTGSKKNKNNSNDQEEYAEEEYTHSSSKSSSKKQTPKSLEATYAKSDFVPGDEIIFEDLLVGEQLGEFPSRWDLERGVAEIAKVNGETVIAMAGNDSWIKPLMVDNSTNYLGDVFTVEYDMLYDYSHKDGAPSLEIDFMAPNQRRDNEIYTLTYYLGHNKQSVRMAYVKNGSTSDTNTDGSASSGSQLVLNDGQWHHYAISFNKRALKVYIDGVRVINIPNAKAGAGWITFFNGSNKPEYNTYLKNVRIAKGAVPLYDRMMTDGKIITYGITFDVGKATIKPESMGEINRIVTLMTENPDLKFSVEGHTDNTGNPTSNQTLSEQRSEAIVAKLMELGIAQDRLTAVGKGQNSPIADNTTDEGRAKNRRVEFVKQ